MSWNWLGFTPDMRSIMPLYPPKSSSHSGPSFTEKRHPTSSSDLSSSNWVSRSIISGVTPVTEGGTTA